MNPLYPKHLIHVHASMTELVEQLVSEGHAVTAWEGRTRYYEKYNHSLNNYPLKDGWDPQWIWIIDASRSTWAIDGMNRFKDRGLPWAVARIPETK